MSTLQASEERIPYDKLRPNMEQILWYQHIPLFTTELDDNGLADYSVRIRVMPSRFFVLARYWLRVDHVLVRSVDTRVHYAFGDPYMLVESSVREATYDELLPYKVNHTVKEDVYPHLPVLSCVTKKIEF